MKKMQWIVWGSLVLAISAGLVQATNFKPQAAPVIVQQAQTNPAEQVEEPNGAPDNDAVEQGDQAGQDAQCGPQDASGTETADANEAAEGTDTDTAQDCK